MIPRCFQTQRMRMFVWRIWATSKVRKTAGHTVDNCLMTPAELNRSFGLLSMIGFAFSVVTSWTALSGTFIVGVTSGGPPVMVFSFLAVCFLTFSVVIPMAEMCSMYPVAGGQYTWCAVLAPPKIARGLSYVDGWFMIIGMLFSLSVRRLTM